VEKQLSQFASLKKAQWRHFLKYTSKPTSIIATDAHNQRHTENSKATLLYPPALQPIYTLNKGAIDCTEHIRA